MQVPTPLFGKLPESVYEPAEDTFLLLDGLQKDGASIEAAVPRIVVEIGSGSGVVSSFVQVLIQKLLPNHHFLQIAIDLNRDALESTVATSRMNNQRIPEVIQANLMMGMDAKLVNSVDLLLFNPPYVPTEKEPSTLTECCWAGGPNGRAAVDRLMPKVTHLLSPTGCFYLIALKSNNIPEMFSNALGYNLTGEIIMERRCGHEYLYVLKFKKVTGKQNN